MTSARNAARNALKRRQPIEFITTDIRVIGTTVCLGALACSAREGEGRPAPEAVSSAGNSVAGPSNDVRPYPPGRFRLLPFPELDRVVVWVSHILVRHADSTPEDTPLRPLEYRPDPPAPARSRADALVIAHSLAEQAAATPERFEDLARRHSEDVVTRDWGGSLGGVKATQLPPEFNDALAVLAPGQVSRVIETSFGFHVLKRRAVPPPDLLAGLRLVLGYVETIRVPGETPVQRSRQEALELAEGLLLEARAEKTTFEVLASERSDTLDAAGGGDFGVWSTREPGFSGREVEVLSGLEIGSLSRPMDTPFGFQIFKRIPADVPMRYAMAAIRLKFEPAAQAPDPFSREEAAKAAATVLAQLKEDPATFEALQRQHCCEGEVDQWTRGRGSAALTQVLDGLTIGEVATEATETDVFWVIPKRLDPALQRPMPAPLYEYPAPSGPDFQAIIAHSSGEALARYVRMLGAEAPRAIGLGPNGAPFNDIMERFATALISDDGPAGRLETARLTQTEIRTLLGPEKYRAYERFVREWGSQQVLDRPN